MEFIDFKKIDTPLPFIRELMKDHSEEEIMQAQEQFSSFLNTLQEVHAEMLASEHTCGTVDDRLRLH